MEWQVQYEPRTRENPWSVYKTFNGKRVYDQGFLTEEEAREFARKREKNLEHPGGDETLHKVEEASIESFPASDPPAWTKTTAMPAMPQNGKKSGH